MIRLDGNAILIADPDAVYGLQLSETLSRHGARCFRAEHIFEAKTLLQKYDFDLVISNYYLSDGIIHQLINWSSKNLQNVPIFTCIGYPYANDGFSHRHSIAEIFSKKDSQKILTCLSRLLFDANQFQENVVEMFSPTEILIELHLEGKTSIVRPIEVNAEGIFLHQETASSEETFGILKFSLISGVGGQNFLIPGYMEGAHSTGQFFKINQNYRPNWAKFLSYLNVKQLNVTSFLGKASGL